MSGRKRIYVDEGEWNRLRREAGKLSELRCDVPKLIDQVRDQSRRDLDRAFSEFDQRQAGVEQSLSALSEQARRFEGETTRRLRDNSRKLRQAIDDNTAALRSETGKLLGEQRAALHKAIDEERRDRQQRMAELDRSVTALERDHSKAAEMAESYLADAFLLRDQVREFPHERYCPGVFEPLERQLATAERNLQEGVGAYGLSGAQSLYHQLSDLRVELERKDLDWRLCRTAAEQALLMVQGLIGQNERLTTGPDGSALPDGASDVDYWSRGALSRLRDEVTTLLGRIRDDTNPLPTEELQDIAERTGPELEQRLDTVVGQAVTAVYASQLRTNFAELIAEALDRHHQYEVVDSCFAGDDQRGSFYAKSAHHVSGSEIVIEVEQVAEDQPDCTVRLHSFDRDAASEDERRARTDSIADSLRERGITLARTEEEGDEPDTAKHDLGAVRRQQPTTDTTTHATTTQQHAPRARQ